MKLLIKSIIILFLFFTSMLLIMKFTGLLTIEDIKAIFTNLQTQPSYMIGSLVILLLFIDLFIAIPTMTVILLAGYFLGFQLALLYTSIGLLGASLTGYTLSIFYGERIINKLSNDQKQINQMKQLFNTHGMILIMLSRAVPLLPEISACLAGTCHMNLKKYLLAWTIGTIPYISIMTYAGSISSIDDPTPALVAALGVTVLFSIGWFIFKKINKYK
jgi:uncharacterized membrane protein YdjX (TVP38/TMEM64 family)